MKRVDELGFYNLGAKQLADKLNLSMPKTLAVVDQLGIRTDPECYKEFRIGRMLIKRYSNTAVAKITEALKTESANDIWMKRHPKKAVA